MTKTGSPPSGRQITLSAHDQEIVVVEVGGGLRTYRAGGRDILDGYGEDEMCSSGRGQLLAPWPNRLGDGAFEWEGRRYQCPITEVDKGNAIHGLVRWSGWTPPDATIQPWGPQTPPEVLSMTHRLHPQPGWPWALEFRVSYRLVPERGLEVRTVVTNASDRACPVGFGWHPYLAVPDGRGDGLIDGCTLTVPAATAYRTDDRALPVSAFAVDGTDLDFRAGRPLGEQVLDTAFTDLQRDASGRATVVVQGAHAAVRLWVDRSFTHLMVFSGDTVSDPIRRRRGLAVEPMTCAPDMLRSGDGCRVLQPGEYLEGAWGIDPFGLLQE